MGIISFLNNMPFNFLIRLYGLRDETVEGCKLVAAHCYGLDRQNQLPDATIKTVNRAIDIALHQEVPIIFADTNYFGAGMQEHEN